jgi:hypothetical protein
MTPSGCFIERFWKADLARLRSAKASRYIEASEIERSEIEPSKIELS